MEFNHIFTKAEFSNLWAVVYPGAECDAFTQFFNLINDTQYLFEYFTSSQDNLSFWGISVDDAIERVQNEADKFTDELWAIENNYKGYETVTLQDIFEPLHTNIYSLNTKNEAQRKGKPDFHKPMLRLYGIELEDGCIVITGGSIKLTKDMEDCEKEKLVTVNNFLREQNIHSREGLIN